jgi:hypothetical protein
MPLISKTFFTGPRSWQTVNSVFRSCAARAACNTARNPALEM